MLNYIQKAYFNLHFTQNLFKSVPLCLSFKVFSKSMATNFSNGAFPNSLEGFGYQFNEDGKLRKIDGAGRLTESPFEFNVSSDPAHNQKHYEALGEVITEEVYQLLEKEGLKRLPVPPNSENASFIFADPNFLEADKIIVFIHGSGVVRAGQWSRSLIINDSLKSGTQIPYIQKARALGYGVLVLNTNDNYLLREGKKVPIKGSDSPEEHAKTVWDNYVLPSKARKIAIVAHSFGGIVTMSLASHFEEEFMNRVFAIALTDSVHGKIPRAVSSTLADHLSKIGRNWVSYSGSLDDPLPEQPGEIQCVSAGTAKHEMTSFTSFTSVFRFLEERYHFSSMPRSDELLQSRYSCCINYIMSKDNLLFNV